MNGTIRIVVCERFHQIAGQNFDFQFLQQLAMKALLEGFARLAFSSRKLPEACEMGIRFALGDKQFPLAEDQARRDLDDQAFPRPMLL